MKTKQVIESALDENFADYDFLFFTYPDLDKKVPVKENIQDAARAWNVSEQCVKDLIFSFDYVRDQLVESLKQDLKDIWKQVSE